MQTAICGTSVWPKQVSSVWLKRGIADLLDAVDMADLDHCPVWPQRRCPEKIINRCHHLNFLPTEIAMIIVIIMIIDI